MEDQSFKEGNNNKEGDIEITNDKTMENNKENIEQKTVEEIEADEKQNKKVKNLLALVILLAGLAIGSFFVDVTQLISGSGFSKRVLKTVDVFEAEGKTWVGFKEPKIEVKVLTVGDEDLKECPTCDPQKALVWLKRFFPTMVAKKVVGDSPEGKKLMEENKLKTVPSFVFSNKVKDTKFFQEEAKVLFDERGDNLVLNSAAIGIPVGKYLATPQIEENDPVIGNREAKVKIVVFSDHQCPFCSKYFGEITGLAKEMGDKVVLAYKDMPLDFHPQSKTSALAAHCAQEQGKFWEMSKVLYATQDAWGKAKGEADFTPYAKQIGLDINKFKQCITDKKYVDVIEKNATEGHDFGVSGTPSTFINDQFFGGVVPKEQLKSIIEKELNGNEMEAPADNNQKEEDKK